MPYKSSHRWVASVLLLSMVVLSACVPAATSVPPAQEAAAVQPTAQPAAPATEAPAAAAPAEQGQKQITIYMQMGGTQGDAGTLARTNGAKAAAADFRIKLVEQSSGWDPQKMIDQFKQAMAANPDGIEIMGHPGEDAFAALVDQAESQGIIVTSGNNPLPNIEAKYQTKGFGYAGADLHDGGYLDRPGDGRSRTEEGRQGPHLRHLAPGRAEAKSPQGIYDALTAAGVVVDKLDVSNAVDTDSSLAIPILTAYIAAHPDLKAIGTQHGNITAILPKVLQAAGKKPGDIICGGIDLSPATVDAIKKGWISASFDQVLYLQGYYPVQQICLDEELPDSGSAHRYRCRHGDPAERRSNRASHRAGHPLIRFYGETNRL